MVIKLSSDLLISSGRFRDCYVHPAEPSRCIKVLRRNARLPQRSWLGRLFGRASFDPNLREFAEYERHRRAGVALERYFPRLHGFVETDLGPGLCFDRLRGSDGRPPVRLSDLLNTPHALSAEVSELLLQELGHFASFCIQHGILSTADGLENVGVLRDGGRYRFVAFDMKGYENWELMPNTAAGRRLRRRKIERRFKRRWRKARLA
jgi:hypothetical protein